MNMGEAIGILVAIGVWLILIVFIGMGVGRWITRRNRRR